jgi:hypothetical protein
MSCCFSDVEKMIPNKPYVDMKIGVGKCRKVFKLWIDCYLIDYIDPVSGLRNSKSCYASQGSNSCCATYKCKDKNCQWTLTIRKNEKKNIWFVKNLNDTHVNCSYVETALSKNMVARFKKDIFESTNSDKMKEFKRNASQIGFSQVNKYQIYRVKNEEKEKIESFDSGFEFIESYLYNLKSNNPGSIIDIQYYNDDEGKRRFGRVFVMMRAMVEVVIHGCKPIVSFDAGFTKCINWNKFQILVSGN